MSKKTISWYTILSEMYKPAMSLEMENKSHWIEWLKNKLFSEAQLIIKLWTKVEALDNYYKLFLMQYIWLWCSSLVEEHCLNHLLLKAQFTQSTYVVFVFYSNVVFNLIPPNQFGCSVAMEIKKSLILGKACTIQQQQAQPSQQCTPGWVSKAHKEMDTGLDGKPVFLLY